ncbi:MAG TPA: hypothetical protein VII94_06295 [Candidatus Saccharimonadales bacterium]
MRQTDSLISMDGGYSAIKKKIDADYTANQSIWQIYWTEATIDTRLEAGDTSLMAELNTTMPNSNKGSFYFNRVRPLCNMVSGYQRRNRKSTIVVPLENGDQATSDQLTKVILSIYKREGVYETISEAFHQGGCIAGLNLLHVYMDYRNDPVSGDLKVDNCSYNSFFIDPYFRKPDLSDCSFVWRRSYLSHSAAAALMPDRYEEIMSLPGNPTGTGRDGRFQYMPESFGQTQQNRLAYDEYYYRDYRKQKLLVDKTTGETFEITNQSDFDVNTFLEHYPQVTVIEQDIPTVRMAIMIQDKVFYDGPNSLNIDVYPFVPVLGYYNPMMPYFYSRIQGICRSLRDPQILFNRRVILSADAAESVVNSGWIFKENAVVDVKHLFQTGQGRIIPLKEEAAMTDIQQITPPSIPQYFFQLQDTFSKEMNLVSGINEELMGSALDDKAGILSALRQGAGLTTLQPLFDRLDYSQNLLGELVMKVVQLNYTPGKIKNLLEGQEPAPLFYNKSFGKYHCMVEMGFNTESQKQMQFAQLMQLKELGVPIPDSSLLDAATIQNKDKIIQQMEQQQQQQEQMQQMQMQSQMEEAQSRIKLAEARAIADEGLGFERISRVDENKALGVERRAKAVADDNMALLNFVKAMKEIENIDITHLQQIVSIQQMIKQQEAIKEEKTNNGTLSPTNSPQPARNGSGSV